MSHHNCTKPKCKTKCKTKFLSFYSSFLKKPFQNNFRSSVIRIAAHQLNYGPGVSVTTSTSKFFQELLVLTSCSHTTNACNNIFRKKSCRRGPTFQTQATMRSKNLVWLRNLVFFEVFGVKFSAKK